MQVIESMGKISYLINWIVTWSKGPIQRRPVRRAVVFARNSIGHCREKEESNGKRSKKKKNRGKGGEEMKMAAFEIGKKVPKKSRTKHIPIIDSTVFCTISNGSSPSFLCTSHIPNLPFKCRTTVIFGCYPWYGDWMIIRLWLS